MAFPGGAQIAVIRHGSNVPLPAMQLDFLNNTSLNSRVTFSRGTNATLVDSTGKITYAPSNLLLRSEEFDNAVWAKASVAVTANAEVAPDGTTTADRIVSSGGSFPQFAQSASVPAGNFVFSIWVKSDGTSQIAQAIIFDGVTVAFTPTETWQRISGLKTNSTGGSKSLVIATNSGSAPASSYLVWGAQLEPVTYQTTPGPYVATTASAYYGPRFDYDPVTLAPRGLLIEEARTNLALRSAEFTNASWTKSNATVTANVTSAPDGTATALKLAEDAATGFHGINQLATLVSGTAYTQTFFVKAAERNWIALTEGNNVTATAYFNLATGTVGTVSGTGSPSATIVPFGNGWYRVSLTFTPIANAGNIQIRTATADGTANYAGTVGSGVYVWGAQLEAGAFATSYIPTVASTVSRSADVATMTGTNFSSWYNQSEGTFVFDGDHYQTGASKSLFAASDGTTSNEHFGFSGSTNIISLQTLAGGVAQTSLSFSAVAANTIFKVAYAYQLNNFAGSLLGGTVATDSSGILPTVDRLSLGIRGNSTLPLNGHIRAIAYYNTRLPNTQLQTLTAPSLASPLALDFISPTYTVGY
jgi:hypothetical protein